MSRSVYRNILVPSDISEFGTLALRYAAAFREKVGSRLTLLHADEIFLPAGVLAAPLGFYADSAPPSHDVLLQRFREYGISHIGDPFDTLIIHDNAARAILRAAKHISADLIIMGTHGRTGLRRALLGSVTENVLHETSVPVLTVTPELMKEGQDIAIRRILCPVNFTRVARQALEQASSLAAAFDAELNVVYVAEALEIDHMPEVETALRHWIDPQLGNRCRFTHTLVTAGDPAEQALSVARDTEADLIVIGAQHRFFSDATVIGTTTQQITRFARIPVLTAVQPARAEVMVDPEPVLVDVM